MVIARTRNLRSDDLLRFPSPQPSPGGRGGPCFESPSRILSRRELATSNRRFARLQLEWIYGFDAVLFRSFPQSMLCETMKIVHLVAGAGSMYCGSCLHGNTLAAALRTAGGDVLLAPLYTPLRTDDEDVSLPRIAFGGVNVYLQQHWGFFRHTPWMFDRLLDHPSLLRWASRRGAATRPERLGELTVSMLRGEEGRQRKELEKLLHWLETEIRPNVVHLSNVMLSGVARRIGRRLAVPVVATLSGEDIFWRSCRRPTARPRARSFATEPPT